MNRSTLEAILTPAPGKLSHPLDNSAQSGIVPKLAVDAMGSIGMRLKQGCFLLQFRFAKNFLNLYYPFFTLNPGKAENVETRF